MLKEDFLEHSIQKGDFLGHSILKEDFLGHSFLNEDFLGHSILKEVYIIIPSNGQYSLGVKATSDLAYRRKGYTM